jgi:hypothetical protein
MVHGLKNLSLRIATAFSASTIASRMQNIEKPIVFYTTTQNLILFSDLRIIIFNCKKWLAK